MSFSAQHFQKQLHDLTIDLNHNELFTLTTTHWLVDLSRHYLSRKQLKQLTVWLEHHDFIQQKNQLFDDNILNFTENRPVNHVLLRDSQQIFSCSQHTAMAIDFNRQQIFVNHFHAEQNEITDLLTIGIGGSHLGPNLITDALKEFCSTKLKTHYLTGTDPYELSAIFKQLNPKTTLVFVASKSFSTLETLWNYQQIKAWFELELASSATKHFIAITNNQDKALSMGFLKEYIFSVPDSIGGRFSLWSAIGLAMRLSLGEAQYQALLAGAHAMDVHFKEQPLNTNIPVLLAILDLFYGNCLDVQQRAVIPYSHRLRLLVPHLQQVEMESNGKSVDIMGDTVPYRTGLAVWGGVGPNSQHSFHQWFYQGTVLTPIDFIALQGNSAYPDFEQLLLSQCLAQAKALWEGQSSENAAQATQGGKPSTLFLSKSLNPRSLGELIALYEHKVFSSGLLTNTNTFDQFGVEAGKRQGIAMLAAINDAPSTLDPITENILNHLNDLC